MVNHTPPAAIAPADIALPPTSQIDLTWLFADANPHAQRAAGTVDAADRKAAPVHANLD